MPVITIRTEKGGYRTIRVSEPQQEKKEYPKNGFLLFSADGHRYIPVHLESITPTHLEKGTFEVRGEEYLLTAEVYKCKGVPVPENLLF